MSKENNTIVVPLQVSAKQVQGAETVIDAMADFSKLPYSDGKRDYNTDRPFLGKSAMSEPFEDQKLTLAAGIHLHWVLPRALRTYHGIAKRPYAAPNRWLVTRADGERWLVESDYIAKATGLFNKNAVTVPSAEFGQPNSQSFAYLGRQIPEKWWKSETASAGSLQHHWPALSKDHHPMTAFGYGEVAFNTFYPNCRSAFGFYDPDPGENTTYTVIGWYESYGLQSFDVIQQVTLELQQAIASPAAHLHMWKQLFEAEAGKGGTKAQPPTWMSTLYASAPANWPSAVSKNVAYYESFRALLSEENLGNDQTGQQVTWQALLEAAGSQLMNQLTNHAIKVLLNYQFESDGSSSPTTSVYCATVSLGSSNVTPPAIQQVALGRQAHETFAAFIANQITGQNDDLQQIETTLREIFEGAKVQNDLLDIDQNVKEAIQERHFLPETGGLLWKVRKKHQPGEEISDTSQAADELLLSEDVAQLLNLLNTAQEAFDTASFSLAHQKFELYADWCKYMQCLYPPLGVSKDLPPDDKVSALLQWKATNIKFAQGEAGKTSANEEGELISASGLLGNKVLAAYQTLANRLLRNNVVTAIDSSPDGATTVGTAVYEIVSVPAPRYYSPTDPVALFALTGTASDGGEGSVNASFSDITPLEGLISFDADNLSGLIPTVVNHDSLQLMQWYAQLLPDVNLREDHEGYHQGYLQERYMLPADGFELELNDPMLYGTSFEYKGMTYAATQTSEHYVDILERFDAGDDETVADYVEKAITCLTSQKIVTQSLGGFRKGLLQYEQNIQIPIADPLGFANYREVIQLVAEVLGDEYVADPQNYNSFLPFSAGYLQLDQVQLIDQFGVTSGAAHVINELVLPNQGKDSAEYNRLVLQPRFSQPLRLNFRWLSAKPLDTDGTNAEMNSHPASSPICGWLLPNYLDESVFFYEADGTGLGGTDITGNWHPFQGTT
ncbi:MAG: hypothetical protein AAFO69_03680, partial [Bacteroidota bacterium]